MASASSVEIERTPTCAGQISNHSTHRARVARRVALIIIAEAGMCADVQD